MEVNRSVGILKTTLINIEKTVGYSLKNLDKKTDESRRLLEAILDDLRLKSYILEKAEIQEQRKTHLLLLVNTKLPCSSELESDNNVGHVVGSIPQLSSSVFFAITYHFDLLRYLFEIIDIGPTVLSLELLNIVSNELKYLSNYDCYKILIPLFHSLASRMLKTDCKYVLKKLHDHFQILMLLYRRSPEQDPDQSENKKNDCNGFKFLSVVCVLRVFTRLFYGPKWISDPIPLYNITLSYDVTTWYDQFELNEKNTILNEVYEKIFDTCKELMYDHNLESYLSWHEITFHEKTLQNTIGEEVYYLCETLEEKLRASLPLPTATPELIAMLKSIAVRPTEVVTDNNKSTSQHIEQMILENNRFDTKFLNTVVEFLPSNQINPNMSMTFIRKLFTEITYPEIDKTLIKKIIVNLLQFLSTSELNTLLSEFIKQHGLNHFLIEEDVDYSTLIKQVTALYTKDDIDSDEQDDEYKQEKERQVLKQVALLGFHSSENSLKKIIKEGCLERNYTFVVVKFLQVLKPLCLYQLEQKNGVKLPFIIFVLGRSLRNDFVSLSQTEKDKFATLMSDLVQNQLMEKNDFLSHCLLPQLYIKEDTNWEFLADLMTLFNGFFVKADCKSTNLSLAIILFQLAQILEGSRWTIFNFSMQKAFLCEQTIEAIKTVIHAYLNSSIKISDTDWLQYRLKNFSTLTKSYFRKILYSFGELNTMESKLIYLLHDQLPESHEKFVADFQAQEDENSICVGKLVSVWTQNELNRSIMNYRQENYHRTCFVFDVISNGISFIANAAYQVSNSNSNQLDSAFNCLGYIVNNFLDALQKNKVTCRTVEDRINFIRFINRIVLVLKLFPKNLIKIYQFNVIKFVTEELHDLRQTTYDFDSDCRQLLLTLYLL